MSQQHYTLIGVDANGNRHEREGLGLNEGHAADRLLHEHPAYVRVLSGDRSMRRKATYHGKLLRARPGFEVENGNSLSEALTESQRDTGSMVLKELRRKGLRLDIHIDGEEEAIMVGPKDKWTQEDKALLTENRESIIALLKSEASAEETKFPQVRGSRLALMKRIAPELPNPFKRGDVERALRAVGEMALCDTAGAVSNAISYALSQGVFLTVSRGLYKVAQPAETLPAQEPVAPAPADVVAPTPEVTPLPARPVALQELLATLTTLSAQAIVGPVEASRIEAVRTGLDSFETKVMDALETLRTTVRPLLDHWEQIEAGRERLKTMLEV